jgi:hypothetical protein
MEAVINKKQWTKTRDELVDKYNLGAWNKEADAKRYGQNRNIAIISLLSDVQEFMNFKLGTYNTEANEILNDIKCILIEDAGA